MTIHYAPSVANASYDRFAKVMFRWRGSLWKLIYIDVIGWCILYAAISVLYRVGLHGESKALALIVTNYVRGKDERSIMFKRNIIRHMTLVQAMVYRSISPPVMRKYPTLESLVQAGYLEEHEAERFTENNFYQSVSWALALARQARDEGIIRSDPALQDIFRVAEALINPCGDDDEDFDFEWFLARNMRQATAIADEKNSEPPPLCWDKFWRDQKEREQNTKSTVKRTEAEYDRPVLQTLNICIAPSTKEEAESIISTDSGRYSDISKTSLEKHIILQINR
ncbi:Uncharacterized protein Tcan_13617 [Toxocara canis]|uniref:Bestrophin homolog n=1 Tax=Toxocara canis TaxID=6265 RepID=A0A0B2VZK1_TOXCA|nr:Uncharacterized protein Tcan_13617 [Toxocara canis]